MKTLSIAATRLIRLLLSLVNRGGSLPGQIGLKIDSKILSKLSFDGVIIMVTGTNGKTSTSNLIADLLEKSGRTVLSNRRGDNMRAGVATAILTNTTLSGKVKADAMVLEVDELNVRHLLPQLPVDAFVITNFFRDQLDRAREMEQLIETIEKVLPAYEGTLVLNGNDPNVVRLSDKAPHADLFYFEVDHCSSSAVKASEASEGKFCPRCGSRLEYDYYQYSHIGVFHCTSCSFKTPKADVLLTDIDLKKQTFNWEGFSLRAPQEGLYAIYNCAAVCSVAKLLSIDSKLVKAVFDHAPQPWGRNEHFSFNGQECILNLVKNPTGANEVMKVIEADDRKKSVLIVLNDHDQDGTDVSWIYDTHFEKILAKETSTIICSGTRAYDMALRLRYEGTEKKIIIHEDLQEAVDALFAQHDNILYAIATYTALLPTRNVICRRIK